MLTGRSSLRPATVIKLRHETPPAPLEAGHAKPSPADNVVVITLEELAEIEATRVERRREIKKRGNAAFRARRKARREAEDDLDE